MPDETDIQKKEREASERLEESLKGGKEDGDGGDRDNDRDAAGDKDRKG